VIKKYPSNISKLRRFLFLKECGYVCFVVNKNSFKPKGETFSNMYVIYDNPFIDLYLLHLFQYYQEQVKCDFLYLISNLCLYSYVRIYCNWRSVCQIISVAVYRDKKS
jgi:hypothetical protein